MQHNEFKTDKFWREELTCTHLAKSSKSVSCFNLIPQRSEKWNGTHLDKIEIVTIGYNIVIKQKQK